MKTLRRFFMFLISLGILGAFAGVLLIAAVIYKYGQSLPDYKSLEDYKPPVVTRVHANDGRFLAEFAQEKRIFMPISEIPPMVIHAFTSAEDKNFYDHKGVDMTAIIRAVVVNVQNRGLGKRPVGASTITQQVAKNFLLTNEVSYERKIREAILAYKMEQVLSKDRILELYLNQIFLGQRAYGVAAAALHYFNKPLNELDNAEAAFLAALPKAPNNYNPETKHADAVERRNWVLDRMVEDGHITAAQADLAKAKPLVTVKRSDTDVVYAPYFAEEVRRQLAREFGEDFLYQGGLSVRTSLDPALQEIAERTLQNGLMTYDRKRGWHGTLATGQNTDDWLSSLKSIPLPSGMLSTWQMAILLDKKGSIGLADGSTGRLAKDEAKNLRLKVGDVFLVVSITMNPPTYVTRQVPKVQGALVALDPNTGRVLAMQGGWKFDGSEFNRVTQAKRQPGSAFKPFVYLAALDKGYTPSSLIDDSPITFTDRAGNVWRPENYSNDFLGPTPLRVGVEKSRNLMTIHLAQQIGIDTVVDYAQRFDLGDKMPANLSNVLGAHETTLLQLTTGYGMIVNGGKKITPHFIDRIQDRNGQTLKNKDSRTCDGCGPLIKWENQATPDIPDSREQIADPRTAYQMVSILEGVVQRGTAKSLIDLDRPIAGKTGTTNDSKDVWFIGFTPDLVVGVFVGFDEPKSLGEKMTGGSLAVPIFKDFMRDALKNIPPTPFRVPEGVRMVQVNARSGQPTSASDPNAIWEPFLAGSEPNNNVIPSLGIPTTSSSQNDGMIRSPIDGSLSPQDMIQSNPDGDSSSPDEGMGGVY